MIDKGEDQQQKDVNFLKVNRYQVQENAIFIDYGQEQITKSCQEFKKLNLYYRIGLAKNLGSVQQSCNNEEVFTTLLSDMANDCEQIQKQLIQYLTYIFRKDSSKYDFQLYLLIPLNKMINGTHLQIKQNSCTLLSEVMRLVNPKEKKEIVKLAMDLEKSQDEQNKIVSIQLIAKMTADLTVQETQNFFKTDYLQVYKDSSVRLKKQIIHSTCHIAKKEIIDIFFAQKCKETIWGVRKACIEILPELVKITQSRKQLLANILINFTKDGNKIVKLAAFKTIPQFLANFNTSKIPEKLIDIYIHLMDHEVNQTVSREHEIIIKIAYFFPGVMHNLGGARWQQMKKLFNRLLKFSNYEVKLPIASSLHQISRIIGPELSKQYMFSSLDTILKEGSDGLKLNAISHLSEFVQLFQKKTRQNLIDVFMVLQKDPKKWRVRYEIAKQLKALSKIYDTQIVFQYIFPISLKLCNDNVSEVRLQAADQIYFVIQQLKSQQLLQDMALESIKGYGLSQKYIQRQTFGKMVRNLYKLNNFNEKFMDMMLQISRDKIQVVRIALAIYIHQILLDDQKNKILFTSIIDILKVDVQDVSQYFL